jgi:hypothetical protein
MHDQTLVRGQNETKENLIKGIPKRVAYDCSTPLSQHEESTAMDGDAKRVAMHPSNPQSLLRVWHEGHPQHHILAVPVG